MASAMWHESPGLFGTHCFGVGWIFLFTLVFFYYGLANYYPTVSCPVFCVMQNPPSTTLGDVYFQVIWSGGRRNMYGGQCKSLWGAPLHDNGNAMVVSRAHLMYLGLYF